MSLSFNMNFLIDRFLNFHISHIQFLSEWQYAVVYQGGFRDFQKGEGSKRRDVVHIYNTKNIYYKH